MAKSKNIKEYILILEKLKQAKFPSLQDIKEHLEKHGFFVGNRTLQRIISELRKEFFIEITYSQEEKGYFINEEETIRLDQFTHFLSLAETSNIILESIQDCQDTLQYIDFDLKNEGLGLEFLAPLLKALKEHRLINIEYHRFGYGLRKHKNICPYLLKEYLNRWYIVGVFEGWSEFRLFALDRIKSLELSDKTFKPQAELDAKQIFRERIGVTLEGEPQEVVLSFLPREKMYIKTLPLHPSQTELIDNEEEYRISIKVAINYELIVELLKHGNNVKVLSPTHLAESIQQNLSDTLSYYK